MTATWAGGNHGRCAAQPGAALRAGPTLSTKRVERNSLAQDRDCLSQLAHAVDEVSGLEQNLGVSGTDDERTFEIRSSSRPVLVAEDTQQPACRPTLREVERECDRFVCRFCCSRERLGEAVRRRSRRRSLVCGKEDCLRERCPGDRIPGIERNGLLQRLYCARISVARPACIEVQSQ